MMLDKSDLQLFIRGYVECLLWASTDNSNESGGDPLDRNFTVDDILDDGPHETINRIEKDCADFVQANSADLAAYCVIYNMEYAGHDFWLTRNGHGAGFWDRGEIRSDLGQRLSEASRRFGGCDPYLGDDGKVYLA